MHSLNVASLHEVTHRHEIHCLVWRDPVYARSAGPACLSGRCADGQYCWLIRESPALTPGPHVPSSTVFGYDSITVSYTWELISVSMCYSQGDGFNTSLSRLCTVPTNSFLVLPVLYLLDLLLLWCMEWYILFCVGCSYLRWHGHVLPGTILIKIMYVHQL